MNRALPYIGILLITFLWHDATCQTKEEFEEIFIKETESKAKDKSGSPNFKNIKNLSYYPDTLPSWFFNLPQRVDESIYAIGVSDPDLPPEEAAIQALFRAKTIAGMFNKSKFQYFKDIYTSEQTNNEQQSYHQRFDTYFKVVSSLKTSDDNFVVLDQHFTRYNEAIVLIKYTSPETKLLKEKKPLQISSEGTVLYIELQVEEAFEPQADYELISGIKPMSQEPQTAKFKYISKDNNYYSESSFLGKNMAFPSYFYKYTNPNLPENSEPYTYYRGLWGELTRSLMKQLMQNIENNSVKIKSVGQQYNPEITNLTREIAIKNARIYLNGIEFGDDAIDFNIEIEDI